MSLPLLDFVGPAHVDRGGCTALRCRRDPTIRVVADWPGLAFGRPYVRGEILRFCVAHYRDLTASEDTVHPRTGMLQRLFRSCTGLQAAGRMLVGL